MIPASLNVETYLQGLRFPASKDQLIQKAEASDAPQEVVDALEDIPDHAYKDVEEVKAEIGGEEDTEEIDEELESDEEMEDDMQAD